MRSITTLPNPTAIALYRSHCSSIWRRALRGAGGLAGLLREREHHVRRWARVQSPAAHRRLNELLPAPARITRQYFRGRLSPFPKIPSVSLRLSSQTASVLLARFLPDSRVIDILKRSRLDRGHRFATDWGPSGVFIVGGEGRRLGQLGALAHEMGHALAEWQGPALEFRGQVISEAFAQTLEFLVVQRALGKRLERSDWADYQREIDAYNFAFYRWEAGEGGLLDKISTAAPADRSLLPLRETLFTAAGYQAVYAIASLLRSRVLNKFI